jgi:hypothetical protein
MLVVVLGVKPVIDHISMSVAPGAVSTKSGVTVPPAGLIVGVTNELAFVPETLTRIVLGPPVLVSKGEIVQLLPLAVEIDA